MHIRYRVAQLGDLAALEELIPISARGLRADYYSAAQTDGAIGTVFGVDTQLLRDGTYFVAVSEGRIVGCGGWSKRKTMYGGDSAKVGTDPLRDPNVEPAMVRAFFVHPAFARQGIGRELMRLSEQGARAGGFHHIEIVATLPGEPLYAACGYVTVERFDVPLPNGTVLPVVRMRNANPAPRKRRPTVGGPM